MKRPTGVTILAVLAFISGGLRFLAAFLAFGAGSWISAEARSGYFLPGITPYADAFGTLGFWIGLVGMVVSGLIIAAACGLWILARWGYRLEHDRPDRGPGARRGPVVERSGERGDGARRAVRDRRPGVLAPTAGPPRVRRVPDRRAVARLLSRKEPLDVGCGPGDWQSVRFRAR